MEMEMEGRRELGSEGDVGRLAGEARTCHVSKGGEGKRSARGHGREAEEGIGGRKAPFCIA
ncbi:hypothetical protein E2562_031447 [Oryza meyeriana var. granulata]|uniref:Uncharacterized protein n=1 Tax=Oryza meyeriana var. granulata TaxID=110450 RepID=A0A6G1C1B6_9ORYZ|nr:hypothetical protein E2562_031447 [Oryza meyeriana var. granulata]